MKDSIQALEDIVRAEVKSRISSIKALEGTIGGSGSVEKDRWESLANHMEDKYTKLHDYCHKLDTTVSKNVSDWKSTWDEKIASLTDHILTSSNAFEDLLWNNR